MNYRFTVAREHESYVVTDTCRPVGFNLDEVDDEYVMARCGLEEDAVLISFALNMIGGALVKITECRIESNHPSHN